METESQTFNVEDIKAQVQDTFGAAHPEFRDMKKDELIARLYREAAI